MSSTTTRAQARRNTHLAQGAALLLTAGAVAVVMLGVPLLNKPEGEIANIEQVLAERAAERSRTELMVASEDEPDAKRSVDLAAVARRLSILSDEPQEEPVASETPLDNGESESVAGKIELKYLGSIVEPNRRLALISVNGRQRIVPAGSAATFTTDDGEKVGVKVISVASDEVEIERDGVRQRINKADRIAQAVTVVPAAGPQVTPPGTDPSPQASEESEIERRRREAQERRQRILDRQQEGRSGRSPANEPGARFNRNQTPN